MATVHPAMIMGNQPFPHFVDTDTDKFFDLNQFDATPSTSSTRSFSQSSDTTSTMDPMAMTSPMNSVAITSPLINVNGEEGEEMQTPAVPQFPYGMFKQQTGLPPGSIAGLHQQQSTTSSAGPFFSQQVYPTTSLAETSMPGDNVMFPSWLNGVGEGSGGFDFNDFNVSPLDKFVDPTAIMPDPAAPFKVWPGMHQQGAVAKAQQSRQMARLAQQQQQQQGLLQKPQEQRQLQGQQQQHQLQGQRQQQQLQQQVALGVQQQQQQQQQLMAMQSQQQQMTDAHTETTISRILAKVREDSKNSAQSRVDAHQSEMHLNRPKMDDDDDMDDDVKLLASEEGKKLSSKERRQLRNKVSARAFRSRRKEYIRDLETQVNEKQSEANNLRLENEILREENVRFRNLLDQMLRSPSFQPYLESIPTS